MSVHSYDSLQALVAALQTPIACEDNRARWSDVQDIEPRGGWVCADRPRINSWDGALKALDEPMFPAGVARIERQRALLDVPAPSSIKRKVRRGDHGDELDMSRVWNGDLDNAWSRAKRERTLAVSRVLIGVYVGLSGGTSSEVVAWRGVAALALADALESAGYVVCVKAFDHSRISFLARGESETHDIDVTVKGDGEQLDLHKAASLVASTFLARGIIYAHLCHVAPRAVDSGWGYVQDERQGEVDSTGFDAACVAGTSVNSAASAQAWLTNQTRMIETKNKDIHFN